MRGIRESAIIRVMDPVGLACLALLSAILAVSANGTPPPASSHSATTAPPPGGNETYVVKAGDTLYSIALQFNTTIAAIQTGKQHHDSEYTRGRTAPRYSRRRCRNDCNPFAHRSRTHPHRGAHVERTDCNGQSIRAAGNVYRSVRGYTRQHCRPVWCAAGRTRACQQYRQPERDFGRTASDHSVCGHAAASRRGSNSTRRWCARATRWKSG